MSRTPEAVPETARSPVRTAVLRRGARTIASDHFTNGAGQWSASGDGSVSVIDEALEVVLGAEDTVLTMADAAAVPGEDYAVEVEDAARQDLAWLLSERIASRVEVTAGIEQRNRLALRVTVEAFGEESQFRFTEVWAASGSVPGSLSVPRTAPDPAGPSALHFIPDGSPDVLVIDVTGGTATLNDFGLDLSGAFKWRGAA